MLHDAFANSCEQLRRRGLLAPLAIEYQFVIRAKEKVDLDLPLAATPRVKMRRQMVRGVEPEIQAFQDNDLYLSRARLGFIEPPEYEYTSYRTDWQSVALDRCPVLLTSGMPSWGLLAFRHLFVPKSAPKPVHCLTAFESAPFVFKRLERVGDWCFEQGSGRSKIPKWVEPITLRLTFSETPKTFRASLA